MNAVLLSCARLGAVRAGLIRLARARRVPARLPGNFGIRITSLREVSVPLLRDHLRAQMKVTKAKGLNTISPDIGMKGFDRFALALEGTEDHGFLAVSASFSRFRAVLSKPSSQVRPSDRIEALFFGDFLLGPQKKVTRQPGRDPAGSRRDHIRFDRKWKQTGDKPC